MKSIVKWMDLCSRTFKEWLDQWSCHNISSILTRAMHSKTWPCIRELDQWCLTDRLNRILAIFSGIITMSLISIQIVNNSISKKFAHLLLAISILTFFLLFIWTQPIFKLILLFAWSFTAILLTFQIPQKSISLKFLKSLTMGVLLIAFLTLSKGIGLFNDLFAPSVSFHIYHILIATWVFLISYSISQKDIYSYWLDLRPN